MSRANENPLNPASLAANGNQGASAKADQGASELEHTVETAESLLRLGVTLALSGIDALVLMTDDPAAGIVDAADLIEAADQCLRADAGP